MFSFANCIICKGSGAGLPVALVSDFTAGTVGSAVEQLITGGKADAASSIAGGLINAVSGAIYGNNPLGSLKEAFIKGAKAGAATSGINYLSEVFGGQDEDRRSGTLRGSLGLVPFGRTNDPRCGCMPHDPFGGMTEEVSDYGYQYQMPRSERTVRKEPERFSFAEFGREVVTGFVMGGLSSAAFYGAGRAVEAVKSSVRSDVYEGGGTDVWDMTEGGGTINGREYSQHAMERMVPDTPSVRAELSRRAEALAVTKGLQVGTPEYYQFCQKYVDPRSIPPSVVEDAVRNITAVSGHTAGTFVHQTADVTVIVNETGKVITVIPK